MEHYLSEISRVLKKDGRCFITFFLINPESSYYLNAGLSTLGFYHQIDNCYVLNKEIPNFAVAYLEKDILTLLNKYGLEMQTPPIMAHGVAELSIQVIKILFLHKKF